MGIIFSKKSNANGKTIYAISNETTLWTIIHLTHTITVYSFGDTEHYIKTLRASEIDEDDYFSRLIGEDITAIAKDLKEIHKKDKETSDDHSPLSEALDIIEEFEQASGALKKTLVVLGRQLDMNIPKMDPCDQQAITNLNEKNSNVYKRQIAGRGKSRR